jgi:hypothetical protein
MYGIFIFDIVKIGRRAIHITSNREPWGTTVCKPRREGF